MNIKEILEQAAQYLEKHNIDTPRLDAEVLLAEILDMERIKLYVNYDYPLKPKEKNLYRKWLKKRANRIPVAYITGKKEFMSLEFVVNEHVLLPRPETELLVEEIIDYCQEKEKSINMVDVGTGSGAIMVSLGHYIENARILGIDISKEAVKITRKNIERHSLGDRLKVINGDLLSPLVKRGTNNVNIVVSNPPYINEEDLSHLPPEVKKEPSLALDGGKKGLEIYQRLIPQADEVLMDNGLILLEFAPEQAEEIKDLFSDHYKVELKEDHSGNLRYLIAVKNGVEGE